MPQVTPPDPRRAFLLALDRSLAEHLQTLEPTAQQPPPLRLHFASAGRAFGMEVQSVNVAYHREMLDVSSFSDTARQFMPGMSKATFTFECYWDPAVDGFALLDAPIEFDELIGGRRIRAQLHVQSVAPHAMLGGLTMCTIEAVASGPVQVEAAPAAEVAQPVSAEDAPSGRRAIRLK